jgi:hypothetical protein
MGSDEIIRPFEETAENIAYSAWWRRLLGVGRSRQTERIRLATERHLAQRVQDIIVELGLTQTTYSISGGSTLHVPQVVSVAAGPPVRVDIVILPGQTPNDFAAYISAIAHHLGVREARVIPLKPSVIRLELQPELRPQPGERRELNEESAAPRARRRQPSQGRTRDDLASTSDLGSTSDVTYASPQQSPKGTGGQPRSSVEREQAAAKKSQVQTTLPITIYISDESAHEQVEGAVEDLLTAAGAHIEHRDDPIRGSWSRRMRAKIRILLDSPVGNEAKNLTLHAAETRLVHAQDAAVTATLLQNLGSVLVAVQTTKEAVIRTGALLIVKIDSTLVVHQLTPAQQLQLDHQPQLAWSPHQILSALEIRPGSSAQLADDVGDICRLNAVPQSLSDTSALRKLTIDNGELAASSNDADQQIFPEASSGT